MKFWGSSCCAGESESDEDGPLCPPKSAQPSTEAPIPSQDDMLSAGSTSTAQPVIDAGFPAEDDSATSAQQHALPLSVQGIPHAGLQAATHPSQASIQQSPSDVAVEMDNISSPFLDRLAAADSSQADHSPLATAHSDEATSAYSVPHVSGGRPASDSNTAEPAGVLVDMNVSQQGQQSPDAHHSGQGQSLASNLAFQQELQQRTGERQARVGAVMSDADARQVAERGDQGGQDTSQRGAR